MYKLLNGELSQHLDYLAQIRRIFLDGYGILVVRIVIFKISSFMLQNARLLLIFTNRPTIIGLCAGLEEPKQAPLSPDYVPGPKYPEYLASSDTEILDEEETFEEDEEEEHLASADSTDISPVVDHVPSAEETNPFETDMSAATPPPHAYRTTARMSIRAQAPISFPSEAEVARLLAIPTPPPSPLTPVARIRFRAASQLPSPTSPPTHHPLPLPTPSTSRRANIPKADIPPQKRLCLTAPTPRFEVEESLTAAAARQPGLGAAHTTDYGFVDMVDNTPRRHVPRKVGYGIINTWDELVDAIQEGASMTLEGVNARVTELAETHERDT
ncbi:hypothetical protein Tco_0941179 [Tanacetum coccineum]|uniref:Uncharacterized protein n=1 Tax=Tanacetum coccineum TaxID=301880 RepID=A0ABQ5DQH3_9ASTR